MQKKHHVSLQIQLEHLPRLQEKQFKFSKKKKQHNQIEKQLLVEQGLLSKEEIMLHDWPHQAARVWAKHRAKAIRVIYKLTDKGYEYLRNKQQQWEQDKHHISIDKTTTTLRPINSQRKNPKIDGG